MFPEDEHVRQPKAEGEFTVRGRIRRAGPDARGRPSHLRQEGDAPNLPFGMLLLSVHQVKLPLVEVSACALGQNRRSGNPVLWPLD